MSAILTDSDFSPFAAIGGSLPAAGLRSVSHIVSRREMERKSRFKSSSQPTQVEGNTPLSPAQPFPKIGDTFLGFKIVSLLGSGGFGRVYLAQQENLADRPVALKVTASTNREPQRLARLQHPNIMPIRSVHYAHPLRTFWGS